ncbi:MAG TPA: hypothetical protein VIV40_41610 [Kofleriaceae bacterium]
MASEREDREAIVVRRMRQAIAVVAGLAALVIALGYTHVEITDLDYQTHVERAGSDELTVFVVLLLAPAGWVYRKPRWPQLVMWIMWLVTWLMLATVMMIGDEPHEMIRPFWVRAAMTLALSLIGCVVVIVMPLVRNLHKSPPLPRPTRLPSARVLR